MKKKSSTEIELEKKFGKNLKALADIYHETNEELGEAIDVVTNTLSQYMRGERGPSLEVLIACADHFDVPVDCLLRGNFVSDEADESDSLNMTFGDKKVRYAFFDNMMFWISPEKDEKNLEFQKAYTQHMSIISNFLNSGEMSDEDIDKNMDLYEKIGKEGDVRGYANHLWWIAYAGITLFVLTPQIYYHIKKRHITEASKIQMGLKKGWLKSVNDDNELDEVKEFKQMRQLFYQEYKKSYIRDMTYLKNSNMEHVSQLGDYYLALSYIIGFAVSSEKRYQWKIIGTEMMDIFAKCGNKYAKQFNEWEV